MKYAAIAIVLFSTASAFAATDYPIHAYPVPTHKR